MKCRILCVVLFVLSAVATCAPVQQGRLSLMRSGELPDPLSREGTCVLGNRLYIMGGIRMRANRSRAAAVASAEITQTGQLGPWRKEVALPEPRAGIHNAVVTVNNRIYAVGGSTPKQAGGKTQIVRLEDVIWTELNPDGTLKPWRSAGKCPVGKKVGYVVATDDRYLFIIGGGRAKKPVDEAYSAPINPDGTLGAWSKCGHMPVALTQHGGVIMEGRLYIWGGMGATEPRRNTRVFSAAVNNGQLAGWQEEAPIPQANYEAVCVGYNDYLLAIGGRTDQGVATNAIWMSRLRDGRITNWAMVQTDLGTNLFMSASIDRTRGWVFVSGGTVRVDATSGDPDDTDAPGPTPGGSATATPTQYAFVNTIQSFRLQQPAESRLVASRPAAGQSQVTPVPGAGATAAAPLALLPLEEALDQARRTQKNVLLLLYSPEAPGCKRFWDRATASAEFPFVVQQYVLAAADVSIAPELFTRYMLFKVPSFAKLGPNGAVIGRASVMASFDDLKKFAQGGP